MEGAPASAAPLARIQLTHAVMLRRLQGDHVAEADFRGFLDLLQGFGEDAEKARARQGFEARGIENLDQEDFPDLLVVADFDDESERASRERESEDRGAAWRPKRTRGPRKALRTGRGRRAGAEKVDAVHQLPDAHVLEGRAHVDGDMAALLHRELEAGYQFFAGDFLAGQPGGSDCIVELGGHVDQFLPRFGVGFGQQGGHFAFDQLTRVFHRAVKRQLIEHVDHPVQGRVG